MVLERIIRALFLLIGSTLIVGYGDYLTGAS